MTFTFQRFKASWVSAGGDECSGWPSTSKMTENIAKIREHTQEDHRQTVHKVTDTTGISYGVCQELLTENVKMCHTAPSSRQRVCPHIPENCSVCD
jgi:hypothetical protein